MFGVGTGFLTTVVLGGWSSGVIDMARRREGYVCEAVKLFRL